MRHTLRGLSPCGPPGGAAGGWAWASGPWARCQSNLQLQALAGGGAALCVPGCERASSVERKAPRLTTLELPRIGHVPWAPCRQRLPCSCRVKRVSWAGFESESVLCQRGNLRAAERRRVR